MSQSYQHGILSNFSSDEYARREKLRVQGFNNNINPLLVPVPVQVGDQDQLIQSIYEPTPPAGAGNMLSEMFNVYSSAASSHEVLLASQVPVSFMRQRPSGGNNIVGSFSGGGENNLYGFMNSSNIGSILEEEHPTHQLFLMKGSQQHATSSPSHDHHLHNHESTFPMVSFGGEASYSSTGGVLEGQGLSLSLASNNHRAPIGLMNVLRGSKFARPAEELLEEFCSVGRGKFKSGRRNRVAHISTSNPNPNPNPKNSSACSSSPSKDVVLPPLSPADRFEHQRKKAKLLSMIDEVDRRYNHYCDQMQMVVNSFDAVMGYGSATPYTALAEKAMSRHFRCLKDAVSAQLKQTCELLGDKSAAAGGGCGITKGETPRLKLLDQNLRRQRAFPGHLGMMEQEAWRPQRGLPERSVTVLRAWLFEHFLHPYPSDADKHLLARQTGLSRNQVSNWFINARVRLWKPMVEDMYQQEAKDEECDDKEIRSIEGRQQRAQSPTQQQNIERPETNALESDISSHTQQGPTSTSMHHHHHHHHRSSSSDDAIIAASELDLHGVPGDDVFRLAAVYGGHVANALGTGDVSLTLGLRHAGNSSSAASENNRFALRDCGG